jgi:hypothetical protein
MLSPCLGALRAPVGYCLSMASEDDLCSTCGTWACACVFGQTIDARLSKFVVHDAGVGRNGVRYAYTGGSPLDDDRAVGVVRLVWPLVD